MKNVKKMLVPLLLVYSLFIFGCKYIVFPEGVDISGSAKAEETGWSAVVTGIGKSDAGNLHIDLTIQNHTGDWSAMAVDEDTKAVLTGGGKTTNCETVFISTGGHRLAPGFQMRGYIAGKKVEPKTQMIYVECTGAEAASGSKLSVDYHYVTGQYNYYEPDTNLVNDKLEINLDEVVTDLVYPITSQVEGLIQKSDTEFIAINDTILTLASAERSDNGLLFNWKTTNPGEYATYVHIGTPPVIGVDGILYGFYETPDIVSVPIVPASGEATWTTKVSVPQDVKGLYIQLSVETGKQRLFQNYAIDIIDK